MAWQQSALCVALLYLAAMVDSSAGQAETLASAPAPATETANGSTLNGTVSQQQLLTFCVPMWNPLSICDPSQPSQNFTGYDVELVRSAAKDLGLLEGTNYRFKCVDFQTLVSDLTNSSGLCSASTGGVSITSEREQAGIMFTYPTTKLSLGILVQSQHTYSGGWGFTRPFSWSLWLALLLTLLIFPVIIFCIEFFSLRRRIHRDDIRPGIVESSWRSALTLMLFDSFMVTSLGARVAVLAFMFLALLVTSTYTANLAAFVTVQSIKSSVSSVDVRRLGLQGHAVWGALTIACLLCIAAANDCRIAGAGAGHAQVALVLPTLPSCPVDVQDLRGKAVGTSPIYMDRLRKYGLQPTPYPFNKGSDYLVWRDLVASGELTAVIRDLPALQWLADNAPNCDVTVLSQTLEPFDYGIAFHANSSDALVDEWSRAVLRLQEDGTLNQLYASWITSPGSGCQTDNQVNEGAQSVAFIDLYGLWIILAGGIGLGVLLMVAQRTLRHYQKHASLQKRGDGGGGGQLDGSPLPEGRRPLRLLSALRSLPRTSAKWTVSGRGGRKGGKAGGNAYGATESAAPGSTLRTPRSPGCTADLESQTTTAPSNLGSPSPSGTSSPARSLAAGPTLKPAQGHAQASQAQQAQQERASGSVHRPSALQSVDSIYSAVKWKSVLRQGGRQQSEGGV